MKAITTSTAMNELKLMPTCNSIVNKSVIRISQFVHCIHWTEFSHLFQRFHDTNGLSALTIAIDIGILFGHAAVSQRLSMHPIHYILSLPNEFHYHFKMKWNQWILFAWKINYKSDTHAHTFVLELMRNGCLSSGKK